MKMNIKKIILLIIPFSFVFNVQAQNPEWMRFDGLYFPIAYALYDDDEYLWIGAREGLIRFHKKTYNYDYYSELDNPDAVNNINKLVMDRNGVLWLTNRNGLISFYNGIWTRYNTDNSEIHSNYITSIAIDEMDNVWFGTENGIGKFDGTDFYSSSPPDSILENKVFYSIAFDKDGLLWAGSLNSFFSFDGVEWKKFQVRDDNPIYYGDYLLLHKIVFDSSDNIWFAGRNTVIKFDGNEINFLLLTDNFEPDLFVSDLLFDKFHNLWIGTSKGLYKFNGAFFQIYNSDNSGIPANYISALTTDLEGNLWIGTNPYENINIQGGLTKFSENHWETIQLSKNPLSMTPITSIVIDRNNNKWFANNGIIQFDGQKWHELSELKQNISKDSWLTLKLDLDNSIWAGSRDQGIHRYNNGYWMSLNKENSELPGNKITDIAFESNGIKWFGTDKGLVRFDGKKMTSFTSQNSPLPRDYIYSISIDEHGRKWIGLMEHLVIYDNNNWLIFSDENSKMKKGHFVNKIYFDSTGSAYIGLYTTWESSQWGGLIKYDGNEWQDIDLTQNQNISFNVVDIKSDSRGILWVLTRTELYRFDGSSSKNYNFYNSPLLPYFLYSLEIDKEDNIWIGGVGYIIVYNEQGIKNIKGKDIKTTPPQITSFGLEQNYPNPFNPWTNIRFTIYEKGNVTVKIYNSLGQEIIELVNSILEPGYYEYPFIASDLSSGVYLYRIQSGNFIETKKMILMK